MAIFSFNKLHFDLMNLSEAYRNTLSAFKATFLIINATNGSLWYLHFAKTKKQLLCKNGKTIIRCFQNVLYPTQ